MQLPLRSQNNYRPISRSVPSQPQSASPAWIPHKSSTSVATRVHMILHQVCRSFCKHKFEHEHNDAFLLLKDLAAAFSELLLLFLSQKKATFQKVCYCLVRSLPSAWVKNLPGVKNFPGQKPSWVKTPSWVKNLPGSKTFLGQKPSWVKN